jgi:fatty acid synthase subunit alpha
MARRTLASKYAARDFSQLVQREVLSYTKDTSTIYYEADIEGEEAPEELPAKGEPTLQAPVLESPSPSSAAIPLATPSAIGVPVEIPDQAPPATDIVRAVVALKIKVALESVPLSSSIKEIAKGRQFMR